jgi:hypothetical protein
LNLETLMTLVAQNTRPDSDLRENLESIPGVEKVVVDADRVWLISRPQAETSTIAELARKILQEAGLQDAILDILVRSDEHRERVRFESVERYELPDVRVRVRVALEWKGERALGEATGEKGSHIELRTAALAALAALEQIADRPVDVRLAGVKSVRAFDAELMVVSLYRPGPDFQKYLGAVLVGADPLRAAALAVLHALNRTLGNYLMTR